MYIVFKKCNKDFCLAINVSVFYVYNLFLEYRDLGEGSGLGARGSGLGARGAGRGARCVGRGPILR